jgi:hypothetical protein
VLNGYGEYNDEFRKIGKEAVINCFRDPFWHSSLRIPEDHKNITDLSPQDKT